MPENSQFTLPRRRVIAEWLRSASYALVNPAAPYIRAGWVEKRFLALRVAIWTKPMRWFGTAFIWLQHVSRGPFPDWLKLIILLFSAPIFQASHFCFQRAYSIQLRRIRLAGLNGLAETVQNMPLKLDGFDAKRLSVSQTYHRLCDTKRRIEACNLAAMELEGVILEEI